MKAGIVDGKEVSAIISQVRLIDTKRLSKEEVEDAGYSPAVNCKGL